MVRIKLTAARRRRPGGSARARPPLEVAAADRPARSPRDAVVARVDGELVDLSRPLAADATARDPRPRRRPTRCAVLRHSTAHATAQAVQELFPGTRDRPGSGDRGRLLLRLRPRRRRSRDEDLAAIEARMREIVARDLPIERARAARGTRRSSSSAARTSRTSSTSPTTKGGATVSLYRQGEWTDFCRGPHVPLDRPPRRVQAARPSPAPTGSATSSNKMLQRIYGTAFFTQARARRAPRAARRGQAARSPQARARARLFSFHPEAPASPFFHPRGARSTTALVALRARAVPRLRLRRGDHAADLRRRAVEALGPLRALPREHVLHRRWTSGSSRSSR